MPVRKIPRNHLVVTGRYASAKVDRMVDFESLLEKEHMLLLDFDDDVEKYEEQPVNIPVPGVPRGYTVDLMVHFKPHTKRPIELVEVKPRSLLEKDAMLFARKFAAAERYCEERRWKFVKRTDEEIRTPRLANLNFLRGYQNFIPTLDQGEYITALVREEGGQSSSEQLLAKLGPEKREEWLPVIWHMLLKKDLLTNLDDMPVDVPVWLAEGEP